MRRASTAKRKVPRGRALALMVAGALLATTAAGAQETPAAATESDRAYTLEELERRALENNPTLVQSAAGVVAAEGSLDQAGRYPNPEVGLGVEELATRDLGSTGQYELEWTQPLLIGGRLASRKEVGRRRLAEAETEARAQRYRVLTATRSLFWEAVVADRQVTLHERLAALAEEAVEVTAGLMNTGAADRPDWLHARQEAAETHLDLERARIHRTRVHRQLAAVVGIEELQGRLEGTIPEIPEVEFDAALRNLLESSPEMTFARAELAHARARTELARAEGRPALAVGAGLGWNNELLEGTSRRVGWQLSAGFSLELPVFDANQGELAAARAFERFAEAGVRRVELSIRSRLAAVLEDLEAAETALTAYEERIVPAAEEAYELFRSAYADMMASYPQVLIAQRSLFRARIAALEELGRSLQAHVRLEGLLLGDGLAAPGIGVEPAMIMPAGVGHSQ